MSMYAEAQICRVTHVRSRARRPWTGRLYRTTDCHTVLRRKADWGPRVDLVFDESKENAKPLCARIKRENREVFGEKADF